MSDASRADNYATNALIWPQSRSHLARRVDHGVKAARVVNGAANIHPGRDARKFLDRENGRLWRLQDVRADSLGGCVKSASTRRHFADESEYAPRVLR